jgi:hypothetical protein
MRGVYNASLKISGVTTARTLAYIAPASGKPCEVLYCSVTNASNETNEQIECAVAQITTLGTPTATTITPMQTEPGDQAASATVKGNVTASEPTYSSNSAHNHEGAASIAGYVWDPPANRTVLATSGNPIGVRLLAAITSADLIVNIAFRELG